jgi:phospholipid/cholesterol/gamma-HCH transport system ATP-binding protein
MLYEGRIVEEGTPEEIESSPNPIVQQFLAGRSEGPIRAG